LRHRQRQPGSGDDDVDGGSGHDAVDYTANPTGVDVDLAITGPQLKGSGADTITGRAGSDELSGGDDRDTIDARDGEPDMVTCGAGVDTVTTDRAGVDELNACDFALFPQPGAGGHGAGLRAARPQPDAIRPAPARPVPGGAASGRRGRQRVGARAAFRVLSSHR
jgi:hypothetical protein